MTDNTMDKIKRSNNDLEKIEQMEPHLNPGGALEMLAVPDPLETWNPT
jgi:hypothetical protein